MEISNDLYEICRSYIYELAVSFNKTLSSGIEYEACFEIVMDLLSVPPEERPAIFLATLTPNIEGIPYHKLSPLNQFITTIPGYVFYCLENRLPDNEDLFSEAATLMKNPSFPRYLEEAIASSPPFHREDLSVKETPIFVGHAWRFNLCCICYCMTLGSFFVETEAI